MNACQVFSIGRKTSPETMGIWLCWKPSIALCGALCSRLDFNPSSKDQNERPGRTNMVAKDGSEALDTKHIPK